MGNLGARGTPAAGHRGMGLHSHSKHLPLPLTLSPAPSLTKPNSTLVALTLTWPKHLQTAHHPSKLSTPPQHR